MAFDIAVFRGDEQLVSGELVYVCVDLQGKSPQPVPQALRDALQAYEAGKPMVQVRVGSWQELSHEARTVRTAVFVHEQKIPVELEWDEGDAQAVHAVAFNRLGMPLATGRVLTHAPGVARIGRMAVVQPMRGSRIGRQVLDALMQAAQARGDELALLHAQLSAVPFYLRAGYTQRGEVFEEAGIAHVEMVRPLP
jgi:predicted GNAT family N-acyltransferase